MWKWLKRLFGWTRTSERIEVEIPALYSCPEIKIDDVKNRKFNIFKEEE